MIIHIINFLYLSLHNEQLPAAVLENSQSVGALVNDLNKRFGTSSSSAENGNDGKELTDEQQQSLVDYYYYLSMAGASLKMAGSATATVASTVYQNLPSKEQVRASMDAVSSMITYVSCVFVFSVFSNFYILSFYHFVIFNRNSPPNSADKEKDPPPNAGTLQNQKSNVQRGSALSFGWIQHLQRLMTDTKAEKAAIDRLVSLGFGQRESIQAFIACDRDEALAALFMAQNKRKEEQTKGAPGDPINGSNEIEEEKKEGDVDTVNAENAAYLELYGYTGDTQNILKINQSPYFKQFQKWMSTIFEDEELYYRYLLLFMKHQVADMESLEDIHYDEEFLINMGMDHTVHRKKMMKAIGDFNDSKREFEEWWNETVRFKKYLKLFRKSGIWDLEELLMEIRSPQDIVDKTGIDNQSDVKSIWKHIGNLRMEHSLYCNEDINQKTGAISSAQNAYNPAAVASSLASNMMSNAYPNLSAPPLPAYHKVHAPGIVNGSDDVPQEEGAVAVTSM